LPFDYAKGAQDFVMHPFDLRGMATSLSRCGSLRHHSAKEKGRDSLPVLFCITRNGSETAGDAQDMQMRSFVRHFMQQASRCASSCASSCSRNPDAPLHAPPHAPPHAAGIQMRLVASNAMPKTPSSPPPARMSSPMIMAGAEQEQHSVHMCKCICASL
jgi:hypothetical protein